MIAVVAALVSLSLGGAVARAATLHAAVWSVVPTPNPPAPAGASGGASLNGVRARRARAVSWWATPPGQLHAAARRQLEQHELVDRRRAPTGEPQEPERPALDGACATRTRCFGVGFYNNGASTRALVEQWNGSTWSIVPNPKTPGFTKSSLSGVACPASTSCYAVGYMNGASAASKTFIEHWNGTAWSVVKSANPPGGGRLSGIACLTNASCVAVGLSNGPVSKTLVERWNGQRPGRSYPSVATHRRHIVRRSPAPTSARCVAVGSNCGMSRLVEQNGTGKCRSRHAASRPAPAPTSPSLNGVIVRIADRGCLHRRRFPSRPTDDYGPLIEQWQRKRSGQSSFQFRIRRPGLFAGGSRAAPRASCVAVRAPSPRTCTQWNGTTWSALSVGESREVNSGSVSCSDSREVLSAIGSSTPDATRQPATPPDRAVERGGPQWSVVPAAALDTAISSPVWPMSPAPRLPSLLRRRRADRPTVRNARWSSGGTVRSWAVGVERRSAGCIAERTGRRLVRFPTTSCFAGRIRRFHLHRTMERLDVVGDQQPTRGGRQPSRTSLVRRPRACFADRTPPDPVNVAGSAVDRTLGRVFNVVRIVPGPAISGASANSRPRLLRAGRYGVSRASACGSPHAGTAPLVEQWNGSSWSVVATECPGVIDVGSLGDVSCVTTAGCFATGAAAKTGRPLVPHAGTVRTGHPRWFPGRPPPTVRRLRRHLVCGTRVAPRSAPTKPRLRYSFTLVERYS